MSMHEILVSEVAALRRYIAGRRSELPRGSVDQAATLEYELRVRPTIRPERLVEMVDKCDLRPGLKFGRCPRLKEAYDAAKAGVTAARQGRLEGLQEALAIVKNYSPAYEGPHEEVLVRLEARVKSLSALSE